MLRTKPITAPAETSDGIRISVMSRHTLSGGKTPDASITHDTFDLWMPQLFGPPPRLVGAYYRGEIAWNDFEQEYNQHLKQEEQREALALLARAALAENVTLLCVEETPDRCHRRLLAQACLLQLTHPDKLELSVK